MMSGGGLLSCLERHSLRPENGWNYRGSFSRGTILSVTNGCQLQRRGPKVRRLSGLGTHTNLDWARRVCVYFGVGITIAVIKQRFMDSRQTDQASAEPRGLYPGQHVRGGGEREGDRAPVCPCLAYLSLHTSELSLRSAGQFRPRRQGRKREGDGTVAFLVQCKLPAC